MKHIRVILNGKGAGDPNVRDAVERIRAEGQPLEVQTTWEQGDAARFAEAAVKDGVDVLIAGEANVAPMAMLDDGLMDVLFIRDFLARDLSALISELRNPAAKTNSFVHYQQLERLEVKIDGKLPLNLDGEPEQWGHVLFEIEPGFLPLVLPDNCPLISPIIKPESGRNKRK